MNSRIDLRKALGKALTEWRDAGGRLEEVVWAIEDLAADVASDAVESSRSQTREHQ